MTPFVDFLLPSHASFNGSHGDDSMIVLSVVVSCGCSPVLPAFVVSRGCLIVMPAFVVSCGCSIEMPAFVVVVGRDVTVGVDVEDAAGVTYGAAVGGDGTYVLIHVDPSPPHTSQTSLD